MDKNKANSSINISEHILVKLDEFKRNLQNFQSQIVYSTRYTDHQYEYRHAFLPRELSEMIPSNHLLTETEWRNLGVQQSLGWEHFMVHKPEPHILLFRRRIHNDIAMN